MASIPNTHSTLSAELHRTRKKRKFKLRHYPAAKCDTGTNTFDLPVDIFGADRFLRRRHIVGPGRGGRKRVPIDHPRTYSNCYMKPGNNASSPASNGYNSVMILPRNLLLWCSILYKDGMWISC
jgi:hypothetical protein